MGAEVQSVNRGYPACSLVAVGAGCILIQYTIPGLITIFTGSVRADHLHSILILTRASFSALSVSVLHQVLVIIYITPMYTLNSTKQIASVIGHIFDINLSNNFYV